MAAKKKTNASASTEPPASSDNAIISTNTGNNEDASVDHLADGEFDVKLHYMGIATEDIQAMRRIDACLVERSRHDRQAATLADP